MTDRRPWTAGTVAALAAMASTGCVSLLPKTAPEPLYRFGGDVRSLPGGAVTPASPLRITVTLPVAAQGDALLALTGRRAAYISGGRWVAPATDLFREAAERALGTHGPAGPGTARLTLSVTRFETDYDAGPDAPPVVRIDGTLLLAEDGRGPRVLTPVHGEARAGENRISTIVGAYDAALDQVLAATASALDRDAQFPARVRPVQRDQAISGLPVRPR
jgi:cholesterol transport system auxiliary component